MKNYSTFFYFIFFIIFISSCNDYVSVPQKNSYITVSTKKLSVLYLEAIKEITLSTNADWEIENVATWINISPESGEACEDQIITLKIASNDSYDNRIAQILFKTLDKQITDTITIEQLGRNDYIPLDWTKTNISYMNLTDGKVILEFNDGVPSFVNNRSMIVLQNDTSCFIRKIKSHTISGKKVTLQTLRGNMSDIFIDQSLIMSTTPLTNVKTTRLGEVITSDQKGIIHPTRIIQQNSDGSCQVIYDSKNITKNSITIPFYNYKESFVDKKIWDGFQWEKCEVSSGLEAHLYIKFGSVTMQDAIDPNDENSKKGQLEEFKITFDGFMGLDLLLKYAVQSRDVLEENNVKLLALPKFRFIYATPIPFSITLESDIMAKGKVETSSKVEMTAGFRFEPQVSLGIQYKIGDANPSPISNFKPNFEVYKPTLKGKTEFSIYASIYPRIKAMIYDFIGPVVEPCFYLADDFKGGFSQELFESKNTCGWENEFYSGLDLNVGLSLEFAGFKWDKYLVTKSIQKTTLAKSPSKIEKVLPSDDIEYVLNDLKDNPLEISFKVTDEKLGKEDPCWAAVVKFKCTEGNIDHQYALSDMEGNVKAKWIPKKVGDELTAMILNSEGKTISQVTFAPKLKKHKRLKSSIWKYATHTTLDESIWNYLYDENNNIIGYSYQNNFNNNPHQKGEVNFQFNNNHIYLSDTGNRMNGEMTLDKNGNIISGKQLNRFDNITYNNLGQFISGGCFDKDIPIINWNNGSIFQIKDAGQVYDIVSDVEYLSNVQLFNVPLFLIYSDDILNECYTDGYIGLASLINRTGKLPKKLISKIFYSDRIFEYLYSSDEEGYIIKIIENRYYNDEGVAGKVSTQTHEFIYE